MRNIHYSAWLLVLLSAALQSLIFPLPNLYMLCWVAMAPLLVALLRARRPDTLQIRAGIKLLPATPGQAFLLGYVCGIVWFACTCYWIYDTMRKFGGVGPAAALGLLFLFCLYLGLYHGFFALLFSLLAGKTSFSRRALLLAPPLWVAVELARTRITAFPWDLLGIAQVDNVPLSRIATVTGVYGISFEIMIVNVAFAAAFLMPREAGPGQRKPLLFAALAAVFVLQAGSLISPPVLTGDHTARLVQENVPILPGQDWTRQYFNDTVNELTEISLGQNSNAKPSLIVWPESPTPFYTNDANFRGMISAITRQSGAWAVIGAIGSEPGATTDAPLIFNSGALVSPTGEWRGRYDKMHLVPFGEYVPSKSIFGFAGGLTKEVGDFTHGASRAPLDAGGTKLGVFICYESIFPDEVRRFANAGAQVFVNISNDGWYGDSGAYAQHLKQARMRAVENARWLLRDTNTGVTAAIDPLGRIVAQAPRKVRTALDAPYALSNVTTFYTRHGDWFAFLCAIICVVGLLMRLRVA